MRAGRLRTAITYQRRVKDRTAVGQPVDEWFDIVTATSELRPLAGREYYNASGERATITHEIRTRYRPELASLTAKDRAKAGSRLFDIQSVINVSERSRELLIRCVEDAH